MTRIVATRVNTAWTRLHTASWGGMLPPDCLVCVPNALAGFSGGKPGVARNLVLATFRVLCVSAAMGLWLSPARAAPTLVQTNSLSNGGNGTSISVSFAAPPTAGNLLVAIAGNRAFSGLAGIPAGWIVAIDQTANAPGQVIIYKRAGASEPSTVTIDYTSATRLGLHVYEYAGLPSAVLGQTASNSGSGAPFTSGSVTTTTNNELVIAGFVANDNRAFAAWSNSFIQRNNFINSGATSSQSMYGGADRIAPTPGSYSTGVTGPGAVAWRGQIANFSPGFTISGTVFEDLNYGGGAGRDSAMAAGVGRTGARVELYDNAGVYRGSSTSQAGGAYSFTGLAPGSYVVRAVNDSVSSSRTGYVTSLRAVQTYRTNASSGAAVAVTDHVGGQNPAVADAGAGGAGATLNTATGVFTSGVTGMAQSIAAVTIGSADVRDVDFGFNFDTIVNTNDTGQGSLRQFITNANTLGNTGLAIAGQTAARDVSIFMISDGAAHAGLRAGITNLLTSGVAVITVTSQMPAITQAATTIDGSTQTSNVGNTNAATLGTGGTVGVDALVLGTVAGPEVEIKASGTIADGLLVQADNTTVRGLSIYGFGAATGEAGIRVDAFTNALIENNVLGTSATSFTDPGVALRNYASVDCEGSTNATIRNSLIGFGREYGVMLRSGSTGCTVSGCEFRDNSVESSTSDAIVVDLSNTSTVSGNLITGTASQAFVATGAGVTGSSLVNNSITGNGVGIPSSMTQSSAIAVRSGVISTLVDRNIIQSNYGPGVQVNNGATAMRMTRNSFALNGTTVARTGAGATGQVGIDLNSPTDDANLGTAPFVTLNDNGDGDAGGNGLLNFPILSSVSLSGGSMIVTGYARPGSVIEMFVADSDPSGFGEGQTYTATVTEGGTGAGGNDPYADTDAGTGTYGPAAINGIAQGTDNTNKFAFTLPTPAGVSAGVKLTATATLGGQTSEFSGNATVVPLSADLSVSITDAPDPAPNGGEFLYTILITNNGPGTATNCVMRDTLPAGVTLASTNSSQGTVSGTTIIIANLGAILSGGTASVEILVTTTGLGTLTNRAHVSATETDGVSANNVATATTTVVNQTTSDIPLTQFKRIHGFVDVAVTGGSLRTASNNVNACVVGATSTAALSGIPVTATIRNAYLYWAGSGQTIDSQITLDGAALTADRTFTANFALGGTTYYDFGCFKDVTAQVTVKGNANYTFGGLTVTTADPYCSSQAVLAGWSLIVIYDDPSLSGKTLVLYDGFDVTRNGTASYLLTGIYASAPPEAKATFLVWEGDETLNGASEYLQFNGATLSDGLNPSNNVYNGTINTLGSSTSYGVDLDTFDVSAQIANKDVLATAVVSTSADLVIANAVLLEVKSNVITGRVFEDVNYGGGAGRNLATATAAAPSFTVGRSGATVELYDTGGALLRTTVTGAGGEYGFAGLVDGFYDVRVVNSTVTSSRPGATGTELAVQTYRAHAASGTAVAVTDAVGGATPGSQDSGPNAGAANLSTLTVQSLSRARVITGISVTDVDFGYSFDCVVNRNNSGQGSLRQFLLNANALANTNLAQAGRTAGIEYAVFMLADGTARPGLRASFPSQFTSGVAAVALASALPAVSSATVIDAQTQPGWTSAPIIELNGAGAGVVVNGLNLTAGGSTVRGLVINRFSGSGVVLASAGGDTVAGCWIGTDATGAGAAANGQGGVFINNVANNVIGGTTAAAANRISYNTYAGVYLAGTANGNAILGNSTTSNTVGSGSGLGIDIGALGVTVNNGTRNCALSNCDMDAPVFTSVILAGGTLTLTGYVGSAAGQAAFANARVELFKSDGDASGFGEGATYLGAVTTDASGNINTSLAVAGLAVGDKITATATDGSNNTSEFGGNQIVESLALVKRAFDLNGAPIASGQVLPKGAVIKWLLYVSNPGPAVTDVSLRDVLDPAFAYVPGTLRFDNSIAACSIGGCTSPQDSAIFAGASAGTAASDAADGDALSRSGATIELGNQNVANGQLNIAAGKIYAVVFTVRLR